MEDLLPNNFTSIEEYTIALHSFLQQHSNLFFYKKNEYVIHFLLNRDFEKRMPKEWREPLLQLNTKELLSMVYYGQTFPHFPKSLETFIKTCHQLYLKGTTKQTCKEMKKEVLKLRNVMKYGMNSKKMHEVESLANLISNVAKQSCCETVIDIGSGKGYLTQVLAHQYSLKVLGVDNNQLVVTNAQKRKEKIEIKNLQYITSHLSLDLNVEQFLNLVNPINENEKLLLVGLHTCGDLAATTLKLFVQSNHFKALVNVGCCYSKMTEAMDSMDEKNYGFPMSSFVSKLGINLSIGGTILGVNALEDWNPETKLEFSKYHFRRNSFRCALEVLLHEKNQSTINEGCFVAPLTYKRESTSFGQYAKINFEKIIKRKKPTTGPKLNQSFFDFANSKDCNIEYFNNFYKKLNPTEDDSIKEIDVFWSIRALLGPIIEALILLDRILYLKEQECIKEVQLIRLFDVSISPRGFVIIGIKK